MVKHILSVLFMKLFEAGVSIFLLWYSIFKYILNFNVYSKEVPFSQCTNLRNPWNENKEVKICRDGQVDLLTPKFSVVNYDPKHEVLFV